jgi:hypothetical protein
LFAAPVFDGSNFGDHVAIAAATCCFEIKNAKRDLVKGSSEII